MKHYDVSLLDEDGESYQFSIHAIDSYEAALNATSKIYGKYAKHVIVRDESNNRSRFSDIAANEVDN